MNVLICNHENKFKSVDITFVFLNKYRSLLLFYIITNVDLMIIFC